MERAADIQPVRIKEKMASDNDKDRHDRLVKAFLDGPWGEELDRQRRREYRQGYPKATEAEIQLLMDADDKAGYPPQGLGHARYIMRTSAGSRLPAPTAKDFDDAARAVQAAHLAHLAANLVSKKTYDLENSPELIENRAMESMFARRRARKVAEAAKAKSSEADLSKIEAQSGGRGGALGIPKLQPAPSGMLRPEMSLPSGVEYEDTVADWDGAGENPKPAASAEGGGDTSFDPTTKPTRSGLQGGSTDAQRERIKRCGHGEDEG